MTPQAADDAYATLAVRHGELLKEAGAFLARSLRPGLQDPRETARKIAEDFACEANDVADQITAWRLSNGWEK